MGKGKRKGKGPSVLPPLLAAAPAYPLVAGWLWMPSGPLGLAATPGFFFPLGALPPPLFPSRRPSGWPGPSWPGGSPPCGLSQSFPPPLHTPRHRRPRRHHRARRRAAGPDPPPPEVPLPAPPPPLGPPPGRSRASVDPLRPASPPLAAPLSWPPAPAFTAPQAAPPPAVATPLPPRFPPSRGRSPISRRLLTALRRLPPPLALLRRLLRDPWPLRGRRWPRRSLPCSGHRAASPPSSRLLQRRATAPRRSSPPPSRGGLWLTPPAPLSERFPLRRRLLAPWMRSPRQCRRPRPSLIRRRPPASGAPVGSCWRTYLAADRLRGGWPPSRRLLTPLPPPLLFLALGRPAPASFRAISGLVAPPPAVAPPLVLAVPAPAPRLYFGLCARSSSTVSVTPTARRRPGSRGLPSPPPHPPPPFPAALAAPSRAVRLASSGAPSGPAPSGCPPLRAVGRPPRGTDSSSLARLTPRLPRVGVLPSGAERLDHSNFECFFKIRFSFLSLSKKKKKKKKKGRALTPYQPNSHIFPYLALGL
ncbi:hornerin-like [Iris pallida]|uniref:Hornerin-like n=1 Tax=Iris pallida TaxID=29817 RepID=A0AAX6DS25_IRIPA|nr:hornerin-like [Iris pallida]